MMVFMYMPLLLYKFTSTIIMFAILLTPNVRMRSVIGWLIKVH